MFQKIAASLVVGGMLCAGALVVRAEDQARDQNRTGSGTDASSAGTARDASGTGAGARDATGGAAATDGAQTAGARAGAADAKEETDPTRAFIKEAYIANLFEVQLGQLAAQRLQDDQIKQFARTMVQDHQQANQQLKQIAQAAGAQVSEQLDQVHQAKLAKLQKCQSADFDRKYINCQAAGHMANVLEFRYQSKNAQNDQVKQYAAQTLPKLEQHLKHASDLANKQAGGDEAQTASERQSRDASSSSPDRSTSGTGRTGSTGRGATGADSSSSGTGTGTGAGTSDKSSSSTPDAGKSDKAGASGQK